MLSNTQGVVLKSIKYGEHSNISKVYTREFGLISIISSSGKKAKNNNKIYFQALSLVKLVIYYKPNNSLHRLKEISFAKNHSTTQNDIRVTALKFFIAELLSIIIKEEEQDEVLFQYIHDTVSRLNSESSIKSNFHIQFLLDLSIFLGIQPDFTAKGLYFDLEEAVMVENKPIHGQYLENEVCQQIKAYLKNQMPNKKSRSTILNALLDYYEVQIGGTDKLNSKTVLEMVFE